MVTTPLISVIVPAFNEADNFRAGKLASIDVYFRKQPYQWEVIVVDDGSKDDTADLVASWIKSRPHWKIIRNVHAGKAKAVATGMHQAHGKIRLFTDFDQATPIGEVSKVLDKYRQGFQVIIGSREAKGSKRQAEPILR